MEIKINHIAKIRSGQDGAIYGKYLFRFGVHGLCRVYDMEAVNLANGGDVPHFSEFKLDMVEKIMPHSNATTFGNKFYADGDEFPLLYTNIYNNYAKSEDKLIALCCVYRITREGSCFSSQLVQLIEIGFADSRELWLSREGVDARPYGNFVVDRERSRYYAFVMRDGERQTRYFAFDLPKLSDGEVCGKFGVKKVVLTPDKIIEYFDAPYHNFIQGACVNDGKIYSVEGFGEKIHPAIRIIDTAACREVFHYDFYEAGYEIEPELIDFYDGKCYYGDADGNVFLLEFSE